MNLSIIGKSDLPLLFFDLDGTLLKISSRYWQIHRDISVGMGYSPIGKRDYWNLKRNALTEKEICEQVVKPRHVSHYLSLRDKMIEDPKYLLMDSLVADSSRYLKKLSDFKKIIITRRNRRDLLLRQCKALNILSHFQEIISIGSIDNNFSKGKTMHEVLGAENNNHGIIIGDSEEDIISANMCNMDSVAVSWGIRLPKLLALKNPTTIVFNFYELYKFICKKTGSCPNIS